MFVKQNGQFARRRTTHFCLQMETCFTWLEEAAPVAWGVTRVMSPLTNK